MTLAAQITSDLATVFDTDEFAQAVTYNGTSINAIVDYGEDQDTNDADSITKATIFVKVSNVTLPVYRDTVIINSITWEVLNIAEGDGYIWKLNLYRDERPHL